LQRLQYLASTRIDEPFVIVVVSPLGEYGFLVGFSSRMGPGGPTVGGVM